VDETIMSVEVMKQALDALELALSSHGVMLLSDPPQDAWETRKVESKSQEAITAIRAAIEQAEKPVAYLVEYLNGEKEVRFQHNGWGDKVTPLYAAPRQEQYDQTSLELCEECGWRALIPGDGCLVCARQKPVAWMYDFLADDRDEVIRNWVTQSQDDIKRENGFNVRPLYAAPRQWVGLTDEEKRQIVLDDPIDWIDAVEAKLKEKNA